MEAVCLALRPVIMFSALTGVWPASRGFLFFYCRFTIMLVACLTVYSIQSFFYHFAKAWIAHDRRETSLNLVNIMNVCAAFTAGLAAFHFTWTNAKSLERLLCGMETNARIIYFKRSHQFRAVKIRIMIRVAFCFCVMSIETAYEPFLWPDYFKSLEIAGHLIIRVSNIALEMQYVCIADIFNQLFSVLNDRLARNDDPTVLRHSHDSLSDLYELYKARYELFIVAHTCGSFIFLAMGTYYCFVGVFQKPVEGTFVDSSFVYILIGQVLASNSFILYTTFCLISATRNCGGTANEFQKTNKILLRRLAKCQDPGETAELYRFSHQLMHRRPRFITYGVPVDTSLLVTVAGAMTKYMITMVQFQQSLSSN